MKTTKVKILTAGGGSGGHVTPVVAVIDQLVREIPEADIHFWCDRKYADQSRSIMKASQASVKVSTVFAGKFRRYHGQSLKEKLFDYKTILHNLFDLLLVVLGFVQSFFKLIWLRPKVEFLKGGFVCLPIGYAAALLRIPIVIHDSDTHPGLTNRLLAPLARAIATGAPLEHYNYPEEKSLYVGIPIRDGFRKANPKVKQKLRNKYNLPDNLQILLVTGGGLGAKAINDAIVSLLPDITKKMAVVHVTGEGQYEEIKKRTEGVANYVALGFIGDEYPTLVSGADIAISRAGASAIAELAVVGIPTILIPNKRLVGGHQVKNARVYTDEGAALYFNEDALKDQPQRLLTQIEMLANDRVEQERLSKKLRTFAKPSAAKDLAKLIKIAIGKSEDVSV